MLLYLVWAGAVSAAQPDYKQAMARGAFLDTLPLANAVIDEAERGSARWHEVALDFVRLRIETG